MGGYAPSFYQRPQFFNYIIARLSVCRLLIQHIHYRAAVMTAKSPSFMAASQHFCQCWTIVLPFWARSESAICSWFKSSAPRGPTAETCIVVVHFHGAWVNLLIRRFHGVRVDCRVLYGFWWCWGFRGINFWSHAMADILMTSFNGCHDCPPCSKVSTSFGITAPGHIQKSLPHCLPGLWLKRPTKGKIFDMIWHSVHQGAEFHIIHINSLLM